MPRGITRYNRDKKEKRARNTGLEIKRPGRQALGTAAALLSSLSLSLSGSFPAPVAAPV